MTTLRQAAQQALEAIHLWHWAGETHLLMAAHDALREALAQPERRKPLTDEEIRRIKPVSPDLVDFRCVGPWHDARLTLIPRYSHQTFERDQPLYANPPAAQRPWQGLTAEEILDLFDRNNVYGSKWIEFARTIEAKLKERNK